MKKKLSAILALLLIVALAFAGCTKKEPATPTPTPTPTPTTVDIKLATGGTTGTYYAYGGVVTTLLAEKVPGVTFAVQSTGASAANIRLLATGEVQMAIVQNDVMSYAYSGTELFDGEKITAFSTMAALYAEVCQVVVSESSGINSVADLAGKNVSVGDAGSGVEFNARQILEAYGLTFDSIKKQNLSFGDSAAALKDGKIDAFFCTAGAPTTAVVELATTNSIKLLNITGAEADALMTKYAFYTPYTIPKESYKGMAEDVTTVAVKATFIVSPELPEDVVYNLTKALFENKADIAHAKSAELDAAYAVGGIVVPFHPGAEKYFKEVGAIQ